MTYKITGTIVIDDDGKIDWSAIANRPAYITALTIGTVTNCIPADCSADTLSASGSIAGTTKTLTFSQTSGSGNCVCSNCAC